MVSRQERKWDLVWSGTKIGLTRPIPFARLPTLFYQPHTDHLVRTNITTLILQHREYFARYLKQFYVDKYFCLNFIENGQELQLFNGVEIDIEYFNINVMRVDQEYLQCIDTFCVILVLVSRIVASDGSAPTSIVTLTVTVRCRLSSSEK